MGRSKNLKNIQFASRLSNYDLFSKSWEVKINDVFVQYLAKNCFHTKIRP